MTPPCTAEAAQHVTVVVAQTEYSRDSNTGGTFKFLFLCLTSLLLNHRRRKASFAHAQNRIFHGETPYSQKYDGHAESPRHIGPDRTRWRKLLGLFVNVNTHFVGGLLAEQLWSALQPDAGESPTEPLPELQGLSCPSMVAYTLFIDATVDT